MSSRRGAPQTGDALDPAPGPEVAILLPSITEDLHLHRHHRVTSLRHAMLCPAIVRFEDPLLRAIAHHHVIIDKKARNL